MPGSETRVAATLLDKYSGFNFWRFDLVTELQPSSRVLEYLVVMSTDSFFSAPKRCVREGVMVFRVFRVFV